MYPGTVFFVLGVLAVQHLPELPDVRWSVLLLALPLLWRSRWLRLPALAGAGFLWASLHAGAALAPALDPVHEGHDLVLLGRVASIPRALDNGVRFEFEIAEMRRDGTPVPHPGRVRLSWYGSAPELRAAETWRLTVRLRQPRGFMNPGGFDYEAWLFRNGVRATGYVRADAGNRALAPPARYSLQHLRHALHEGIASAVSGDYAGIVAALAIGERQGITAAQWQVLTATGTNHLMAISGLHVGMVAAMAFFLVRWLWARMGGAALRWPAPKAGAVAGILAAAGYAALAGFAIPTRRALLMISVVMLALLLQRNVAPGRVLSLALVLVVLLDPPAVLAPGFWLSFAAVGAIVYAMQGRVAPQGLWWRWGRIQWVAALGLVPLLLLLFQRFSLVAPLANLLAVPVVGFLVVPLTLTGTTLLSTAPVVGALLLRAAELVTALLWPVLAWLAALPLSEWVQHTPVAWTVLPALVGVVLLLAPRGLPGRAVGAVLLLPMFLVRPPGPPPGAVWLTLLDVGQGLAAVVRTHGHVLVYDTGPRFSATFDGGGAVVAPYLRHHGLGAVDALVVSHGDSDHSGGVRALLEAVPVRRLLSSEPERLPVSGMVPETCGSGMAWNWDGVEFQMLHPAVGAHYRGNEGSCVLRIEATGGVLLLTGDIERLAEARLLREHDAALRSRVLVVPHHGSRSSSSRSFVQAVAPEYALFPVGYRNRWGFPHAEVRERYEEAGAVLLDTASLGAIRVRLEADGPAPPTGYREANRRYWHTR
jgi:competence protein ComEC